jgi:hypothetical protein
LLDTEYWRRSCLGIDGKPFESRRLPDAPKEKAERRCGAFGQDVRYREQRTPEQIEQERKL